MAVSGYRRRWCPTWASSASSPVPKRALGRWAPAIVAALVLLLAGLSIASSVIVVRHFRAEAQSITRLSYGVYAALSDPREGAEANALVEIGKRVRQLGIPVVITDTAGRVTAAD